MMIYLSVRCIQLGECAKPVRNNVHPWMSRGSAVSGSALLMPQQFPTNKKCSCPKSDPPIKQHHMQSFGRSGDVREARVQESIKKVKWWLSDKCGWCACWKIDKTVHEKHQNHVPKNCRGFDRSEWAKRSWLPWCPMFSRVSGCPSKSKALSESKPGGRELLQKYAKWAPPRTWCWSSIRWSVNIMNNWVTVLRSRVLMSFLRWRIMLGPSYL